MYTQGYTKMDFTNVKVKELNEVIDKTKAEANIMKENTQKLLDQVTIEEKEAGVVADAARETETKANVVLAESEGVRREADEAYAKAVPALEKAKKAVEDLKVE
jgi:uncharacterized coiled-coil DUF342 family protein